ncbi:MAG: acetyl-CoA synthetase [Rhodobacteraceae bacterium HLUCCO07]|nr:MAG: acetyl-CoA synthetase [Rhodobacteraceae bacterium HLUCCO07]
MIVAKRAEAVGVVGFHIDANGNGPMHAVSITNPNGSWDKHCMQLNRIKPNTKVKNTTLAYETVSINWLEDDNPNVAANCIDRHLEKRGEQTAIIWEPDDPKDATLHISCKALHAQSCKMAKILKSMDVGRGGRVVTRTAA